MTELPPQVLEAIELVRLHGSISGASRMSGIPRATLQSRLRRAGLAAENFTDGTVPEAAREIEFPEFPDHDDVPIEKLIELATERFMKRQASYKAHTWFPIKVNAELPIGIMWFGDPHLDDNGCNWPLVRTCAELCQKTEGMYGGNVGDTTNNWQGRLVRLYANQDSSVKTARRYAEWFMLDSGIVWLIWILGNHDCVTDDTELLTRRGWIGHEEIQAADKVLGIETETGLAKWQPIEAVFRKPADTIWKLRGARHDLACTAKHRVLTQFRNGTYAFRTPPDLPKHFSLPVARSLQLPEAAIPDSHIRFAAWVLTDGSIDRRGNISIYQSKPENFAHIETICREVGLRFSVYERVRPAASIMGTAVKVALPERQIAVLAESRALALSIVSQKGFLPEWARSLSDRQFDIFLTEYVRGDGSWYPAPRQGCIIYGEKHILDELQALCVAHAWSANLSKDNRGAWRLNVCRKQNSQTHAGGAKWCIEKYAGVVWCLKVPHGNFMIRRNGKAHFTGNCWGDGSAILGEMAKRFGTHRLVCHDWEARFSLEFPSGWKPLIYSAHNFKGNSIYNVMHGPMREGLMGEDADLYVCGDRHVSGEFAFENVARKRYQHFLRVRGFKFMDEFAMHHGYKEQATGCAAVTIFDPIKRTVSIKMDPEEGADFLTFKRKRAKDGK